MSRNSDQPQRLRALGDAESRHHGYHRRCQASHPQGKAPAKLATDNARHLAANLSDPGASFMGTGGGLRTPKDL